MPDIFRAQVNAVDANEILNVQVILEKTPGTLDFQNARDYWSHNNPELTDQTGGRLTGAIRQRIMLSTMISKVVTLRLRPAEYERASALAKQRSLSLNRLFKESLDLMERQERENSLFDDFSRIGAVTVETDVEFVVAAQTEAIRKL